MQLIANFAAITVIFPTKNTDESLIEDLTLLKNLSSFLLLFPSHLIIPSQHLSFMEGGGGFSHGDKNNHYPLLKPIMPPSSTAVDRSLSGQFSDLQMVTNKGALLPTSNNVSCNFAFSSGRSTTSATSGDGIFLNEQQNQNCSGQEKNPNVFGLRDKENLAPNIPTGMGLVEKPGFSAPLIKVQWTRDEDRKLKKLVKRYGVKQWPQIAEKMVRRTNKQCWYRWHNHLRPDIKKESWTEKEERLLVEAHTEVGSRWAEISKRIPGRSQVSIKNHWQTTEKRLNSMNGCKQGEGKNEKNQSPILQEYIKRICANESLINNFNLNTTTQLYSDPLHGANRLISLEGDSDNSTNREMKVDQLDLELRL